jgi:hypothetical protein
MIARQLSSVPAQSASLAAAALLDSVVSTQRMPALADGERFRSRSPLPPLGYHVTNVVAMRAQEEMRGAYTGWLVTVMADFVAGRDGAERQFVGIAMGIDRHV